jgi:hypothetical protein
MSRKDYVLIASTISEERAIAKGQFEEIGAAALASFAERLADKLAADNPRFDRDRFIAACV